MASDYAKALGAKLRTVRNQQGLSLLGVEATSEGRWKAVVVGSYERGDRAVTVQRLSELAQFYGVSLVELLPDATPPAAVQKPVRLDLDLDALAHAPADEVGPLMRFVSGVRAMRGGADEGARVLSLRADDLRTLALIYDQAPDLMTEQLMAWGVLRPDGPP